MKLNYEEDVKVDESALDVEWLRHGEVARKYARHAAYLRKLANKAEQRIKVVKSELIMAIHKDPVKCVGKECVTGPIIEAYYRTHPKHKAAKQEWIDAVYEASYAEMVQKDISYGRKATLENLVVLHGQQYFAGPRVPRNLSREAEKRRSHDEATVAIGRAMKRSTKPV